MLCKQFKGNEARLLYIEFLDLRKDILMKIVPVSYFLPRTMLAALIGQFHLHLLILSMSPKHKYKTN